MLLFCASSQVRFIIDTFVKLGLAAICSKADELN